LLQNRKRNSQNGNKSLTATESEVDKYVKKIRDHNTHIKKARGSYMADYFEKYPEKLEQVLKEEKEKQKLKVQENLNSKVDNTVKRSVSLGVRNRSFKSTSLTYTKDKPKPITRKLNSSDYCESRPEILKKPTTRLQIDAVKLMTKKSSSSTKAVNFENKENLPKVVLKKKRTRMHCGLPLPKVRPGIIKKILGTDNESLIGRVPLYKDHSQPRTINREIIQLGKLTKRPSSKLKKSFKSRI